MIMDYLLYSRVVALDLLLIATPSSHYSMAFFFLDGPEFSQRSIEYQSCIGDNATIACNAIGRPPPDVSLYRNGSLLRMNTGILNHRLPFDSSSKFGSYICISNNTLGVVNITTTFKIKRKFFYEQCVSFI